MKNTLEVAGSSTVGSATFLNTESGELKMDFHFQLSAFILPLNYKNRVPLFCIPVFKFES